MPQELPTHQIPASTPDPTVSLLQNMEVIGTMRTFTGQEPSLESCSMKCRANASCDAFSFNRANRYCYLIDGVLSQQANATFVSGMRRVPTAEQDTSKRGAQYSTLENIEIVGRTRTFFGKQPSVDTCSEKCLAISSCQAISFNRANRFCYLIEGVTSLNRDPLFSSVRLR